MNNTIWSHYFPQSMTNLIFKDSSWCCRLAMKLDEIEWVYFNCVKKHQLRHTHILQSILYPSGPFRTCYELQQPGQNPMKHLFLILSKMFIFIDRNTKALTPYALYALIYVTDLRRAVEYYYKIWVMVLPMCF